MKKDFCMQVLFENQEKAMDNWYYNMDEIAQIMTLPLRYCDSQVDKYLLLDIESNLVGSFESDYDMFQWLRKVYPKELAMFMKTDFIFKPREKNKFPRKEIEEFVRSLQPEITSIFNKNEQTMYRCYPVFSKAYKDLTVTDIEEIQETSEAFLIKSTHEANKMVTAKLFEKFSEQIRENPKESIDLLTKVIKEVLGS